MSEGFKASLSIALFLILVVEMFQVMFRYETNKFLEVRAQERQAWDAESEPTNSCQADYKAVTGSMNRGDLEWKVQRLLAAGYVPKGQPVVSRGWSDSQIVQAMVKRSSC